MTGRACAHAVRWVQVRRAAPLRGDHAARARRGAVDVAQQLGHTDGGQLVMELYGHPSEAGAHARLLAAWDAQTGPVPLSGARREEKGS